MLDLNKEKNYFANTICLSGYGKNYLE